MLFEDAGVMALVERRCHREPSQENYRILDDKRLTGNYLENCWRY